MSVLLGSTILDRQRKMIEEAKAKIALNQPMEQINPNTSPTPTIPQASYMPTSTSAFRVPTIDKGALEEAIKQQAKDRDIDVDLLKEYSAESGAGTDGSIMDKIKKFAPYILGGIALLYFVTRKK